MHCARFRTSQVEQIRIPSSWFEAIAIARETSRVEREVHMEVGHRMVLRPERSLPELAQIVEIYATLERPDYYCTYKR